LETENGLSAYDADVLINQGPTVLAYFSTVAKASGDAKAAANWVTQDVLRTLKELDSPIETLPVSGEMLGDLIVKVKSGDIPSTRAREVFQTMVAKGVDVATALSTLGIAAVDESEIVALCEQLLAANPKTITDVRAGKLQAIGAIIGQAKKQNPNIDPNVVRKICLQLIEAAP
jgi:aspartyl-tRNA(Asn)/glutamyl-tRNA(Gln) amidotransferase subunit B